MVITEDLVREWLKEVKDPEIPVLSLVDLGVIQEIRIGDNKVSVTMTPTFVGCPALDYMKNDVIQTLKKHGIEETEVTVSFDIPWSSSQITEEGRKALKEFGLAPPPSGELVVDLDILEHVPCPYCDSTDTVLKSPFGPTLCRSLHYCNNCKQAFEQFKPV